VPHDQTGLFMIRAWYEDGSPEPLRATIRVTSDVSEGIQKELTVSDPDALCDELRAWLEAVRMEP
jgi:hypothetical protein